MCRMLSKLAFSLSLLSVSFAAVPADQITSLPGWSGALPTPQYSGYLSLASGSNLHYWFVTAESSPATAPTLLWFNGGPGCSSLGGFLSENGPFILNQDLSLSANPYSWNKLANVLYIEAPVGVGFSYSSTDNYKCSDDLTASENMQAVEKFFALFPEYVGNPMYITGESYAGVYVPTLAEAILQAGSAYTGAKLAGIAVGNGCSGTEVGICGSGPQGAFYEWTYLLEKAFIDRELKLKIAQQCDWQAAKANKEGALSAACVKLLNEASAEISNVNLYGIYTDCVNSGCSNLPNTRGKVPPRAELYAEEVDQSGASSGRRLERLIPHGPSACIDSGLMSSFLNSAAVQAAIHVVAPPECWSVCSTVPGWSYSSTRTDLPTNTYPLLVNNINVLVYNGDWDACVPYTDGEGWTSGMGLPVKTSWHPWTYTSVAGATNQVAGYATEYTVTGAKGKFTFATVKGGIHEVPQSSPAQALEMIKRLINNQSF